MKAWRQLAHFIGSLLQTRVSVQGSEQPVGNIAFVLGFDELSSFSRFFKRETGTTPTVYRNHTLLPIS